MANVIVTRYQTDGSGKKRTYKVKADVWHKSKLDGSNDRQPMDVAEACADMVEFVKPYNEKIHKR